VPRLRAAALTALVALAVPLACGGAAGSGSEQARTTASWRPLQPALLERTEVGAARIGRFIYVVGGFLPSRQTTAAVERYDIERDRWRRVAAMPIAVNHPAVAALDGRLYVYGGYTDSGFGAVTAALQRFDPRTGRWRLLARSPTARAAAGLVAARGRLFAVGGAAEGTPLSTLEVYDPRRRRWAGAPPMRVAREHIAAVGVGGRIFVLGGRSGAENLETVESYRIDSRRWEGEPPLQFARSGFAAVAVDDRIVVIGGEELAPGGSTIKPVELVGADGSHRRLGGMRTPRHGLGAATLGRRVFALEGGPQPGFAFSDVAEVIRLPQRLLR
jgi:hypothetical protein